MTAIRIMRIGLRLVLLAAPPLSASGGNLLSKADLRLWETVDDRAAPLTWPWEVDADAATLVFSNRVTHAVMSVVVLRRADETHGSCVQPAPSDGSETLVDATLAQTSGGTEIARETATLAYVAGAGGGPITVRTAGSRDWRKLPAPRVYAFDPAWQGEYGDSGYEIEWPILSGFMVIVR